MTRMPGDSTSLTILHGVANPDTDEAAWRAFLERYEPMIRGWCRYLRLNDVDAEEVLARILLKLVVKLRTFVYDPSRLFRGWLWTLVKNEAFSLYRARQGRERGSGDPVIHLLLDEIEAPADIQYVEQEIVPAVDPDGLVRQAVERVKARVQEKTWMAFYLRYAEELSAREVAARLGITPGAVHQARYKVGLLLQEEGELLKAEGYA